MPDDWENQPLGAPPDGADQIPIGGDGDDGFTLDTGNAAQPVPSLPDMLGTASGTGNGRNRSPYQGRLTPVLYELPLDYLLFAKAWGAAHPYNDQAAIPPDYGYRSVETLFVA